MQPAPVAALPEPAPDEIADARHDERELVLVGAIRGGAMASQGDPITRSVIGRVALPPLQGPAGGLRRAPMPPLPQPYAPDPLVMAVFLGIPAESDPAEADTTHPAAAEHFETAPVATAAAQPLPESIVAAAPPPQPEPEPIVVAAPAPAPIVAAPAAPAPEPVASGPVVEPPVAQEPVAEQPKIALPPDAFGLLLGTAPVEPAPSTAPAPAPPRAASVPAPKIVAVPVGDVVATDAVFRPMPQPALARRSRWGRRDPFKRTTRRERVLARLCMTLTLALALAVFVLRLPIGSRPQLGATDGVGVGSATNTLTTTAPFGDAIRAQTHDDLHAVITTATRVYPVWQTFAAATPVVLNRALPQFGFVTGHQSSTRVGEMSVAGTAHDLVLAEYAGPRECVFARVITGQTPQTVGPIAATCRAASLPQHGWTALD